jgi:hypothetical protein
MGIYFSPDGEKNWQAEQRELDGKVKAGRRTSDIEAEITCRRGVPDDDPIRTRVGVLLVKASGRFQHAVRNGYGFGDVCDLVEKVLKLQPLCADAIALRAVAKARQLRYFEAVMDAAAAVALDRDAGAFYGVPARQLLKELRGRR